MVAAHEAFARSVFDRAIAAADDAERRWPHNEAVLCDPIVEARLLDAAIGPDSLASWGAQAPPERVTLLWPANGAAVPVLPDENLADLAQQTFPLAPGQVATCDRCREDEPPYGALLFAHGAKVIGLVFARRARTCSMQPACGRSGPARPTPQRKETDMPTKTTPTAPAWPLTVQDFKQASEWRCGCGHTTHAAAAHRVAGPTNPGDALSAIAVYLSTAQMIPIERIAETIEALYGISVSAG